MGPWRVVHATQHAETLACLSSHLLGRQRRCDRRVVWHGSYVPLHTTHCDTISCMHGAGHAADQREKQRERERERREREREDHLEGANFGGD